MSKRNSNHKIKNTSKVVKSQKNTMTPKNKKIRYIKKQNERTFFDIGNLNTLRKPNYSE